MILRDKSACHCLENLKEMSDLSSGTYHNDSGTASLSGLDMLYKEFPPVMVESRERQYIIYRTIRRPLSAISALINFYALASPMSGGELHLTIHLRRNIAFFWSIFFALGMVSSVLLFAKDELAGIVVFLLLCAGMAALFVEAVRFRHFVTELLHEL